MLLKLQEAANYIESPDRETILDPNLQATLWGSSSHCHHGQQKAGFSFISSPLPSSFRALAYQPYQDRREDEGKRRDGFLVLNLWELPNRDWRGGVWALVPLNAFIYWPPLVTLEKRWFWVFSSVFVSPTNSWAFWGGIRRHRKSCAAVPTGSHGHLRDSHRRGSLREAGNSTDFLADPSQFYHHCQQPFPRDLTRAQKKKHVV